MILHPAQRSDEHSSGCNIHQEEFKRSSRSLFLERSLKARISHCAGRALDLVDWLVVTYRMFWKSRRSCDGVILGNIQTHALGRCFALNLRAPCKEKRFLGYIEVSLNCPGHCFERRNLHEKRILGRYSVFSLMRVLNIRGLPFPSPCPDGLKTKCATFGRCGYALKE